VEESDKQLEALNIIKKTLGKKFKDPGLIHIGMENKDHYDVDVIPTGSMGLDIATQIGGWPRGRVVELYGMESVGKSTLMMLAIAKCQAMGGRAALIDAEQSLDKRYASILGVDLDKLIFVQPDYGEQALEVTNTLAKSSLVDMIGIDSVAALTPKAEVEDDMDSNHMGLQARMMGQALRKISPVARETNTLILFSNQIRSKLGGYGNPNTTPGGNALKFFASMRVELFRSGIDKEQASNIVKARVVKNKLGIPYQEAEFELLWGIGINRAAELIDACVGSGIIELKGSWYGYNSQTWQGKKGFSEVINQDIDLYDQLFKEYQQLRDKKNE